MRYAIIRFSGRQYKVSEGSEVLFDKQSLSLRDKQSLSLRDKQSLSLRDKLASKEGDKIKISDVLLVSGDGEAKIGTPNVAGSIVEATVLGQEKGEKIEVVKFKAKARYRRHTGFRPQYTRVKIERITTSK